MGFEKAVDICAAICFVVGCRYLKNAGYIWCGIGVLTILLDMVQASFSLLLPTASPIHLKIHEALCHQTKGLLLYQYIKSCTQ